MPNARWNPSTEQRANMPAYLECCIRELVVSAAELQAVASAYFKAPENQIPGRLRVIPNAELLPQAIETALSQFVAQGEVALAMVNNAFAMQSAFVAFCEQMGLMKPRDVQ